jgi:eukaryotic-like serine/threonine-protein kinase
MSSLINHFYNVGEFTLDTRQRVLLREGRPVPLTPKVFETLLILVEHSGQIVEKDELMRRLWPDTFVEEANLTFNVQQLRKSLCDNARSPRYIGTVARRGYRFIADVEAVLSDSSPILGQNNQSSEPSDVRSVVGDELSGQIEPADSKSASNVHSIGDPDAASSTALRAVSLPFLLLIALSALVLVFWRFSGDSNRHPGEDNRRVESGKSPLPLKLEKLTETGQSSLSAISPDGKYVAYTREFDRRVGIWLRQLATNQNVEIVPATDSIVGLAFSNSGEYLYFVKGDPSEMYRVSLLGGVPTKTVDRLVGHFSISPDDSQIAFIRQTINRDGQRECSLIIADSNGTGERKLLTGTHPYGLDTPLWSPDGASIICAYGNSTGGSQNVTLIEVSVADGMKKELSSTRFFRIEKMAWLPRGSGLILVARKSAGENNQLWRVTYPGMEIRQISEGVISYGDLSVTANGDKAAASQVTSISDIWLGPSREPRILKRITQATDHFCWTPGGQVVYSSTVSGNRDLWIMNPDGTEQRQLTVDAAVDSAPAVTPDNRYILFTSYRSRTFQVWRTNLDGSNQIQLTNGAGKTSPPSISPDGKMAVFNSTDDWHLWKVSIDGGPPVSLTDYPVCCPAVSPDGRLIACAGRDEQKLELSILILPFEGGRPVKRIEFRGVKFVGTRLTWTPDGKALIYTAEIGGQSAIVKQSLNGGPPEEIARFDHDELYDFGYSSDGQFLAITRGSWKHDIVLISDIGRK